MVSGLGAHASSVLLVTISGHISVQLRYSNGINWHAGSVRSQAKAVLQRQANVRIRFEGAALASNGSTGLFVYKGVGIAPIPTCVSRAFEVFSHDRRGAEKIKFFSASQRLCG